MRHSNIGKKSAARAAQAQPIQPATTRAMEDPEGVEILLRLRRDKLEREQHQQLPPDRAGMMGELKLELPSGGMNTTGWFDITPALAIAWLDYNQENRKVNKAKVKSFARQIMNGDYLLTHQGMAFNDVNELIDGQHSLKAVILTGRTIRRMVSFGIPKKIEGKQFTTMDVLDQGGRTVGDQLKIQHGIQEPNALRQICNAIASLCHRTRARNLSVGQVMEVYKLFKTDIDWVMAARSRTKGLRQAGVLAAFAFAHSALPVAAEKLFIELNSGSGLADAATFKKRLSSGMDQRPLEHLHHFLTGAVSDLFSKKLNGVLAEITLQTIYGEQHKARVKQIESSPVGFNWFAAKLKEPVGKVARMFALEK